MPKVSADEMIRAKIYRLEELRKYQSYYGPNTPYPVIVEINDLEQELRRLLNAGPTRPRKVNKRQKKRAKTTKKPAPKKQSAAAKKWDVWPMSPATKEAVIAISFMAFVFLLGTILYVTYVNTRPSRAAGNGFYYVADVSPTLRPTFTPTIEGVSTDLPPAPVAAADEVQLPPANQEPTAIPTPVPSLTPTPLPPATNTPPPTATPVSPAQPPPSAPVAAAAAAPATPTPEPPPAPTFPFMVAEQGNRVFQKTSYHIITVYVAVVSEGNIPLGGYKVVADHTNGKHLESGLSDWNWSVANCLDCGYIKQGNLKIDLGPFTDGVWNLYLADPEGTPLSPTVPLSYAADPEQWVWDFIIFKRKSG